MVQNMHDGAAIQCIADALVVLSSLLVHGRASGSHHSSDARGEVAGQYLFYARLA